LNRVTTLTSVVAFAAPWSYEMTITAKVVDRYRNDRRDFVIHDDEIHTAEARLAVTILGTIALAAAEPDGEDGMGRQKLKLLTPEAAAQRACDLAAQMFAEFRKRGWIVKGPSAEEYFDSEIEKD
jgi:hypothetical protein